MAVCTCPARSLMADTSLDRSLVKIATASPRVAHMGGSGGKGGDTARSIGFQWTPEGLETLYLKSKVLIDVRAAGVPYPMSGGWMDIHNLDGLRALAMQLKQLGYTGMHLIHPSHVSVVNEVFSPSPEDVKHWQGLVKAMEEMRATGGNDVNYAMDAPRVDSPDIRKLKEAGAIMFGVATAARTGLAFNGDEKPRTYMPGGNYAGAAWGGQPCNPYDTERVPRGTSSGSGVSVSANLVA